MARNGHSDQGGGRGLPPVTPHSSVSWGENSQRRYTLRAFLEEEASRGQRELATSRGGTGQKYTLKHLGCSPASEVGSQPGAQKPLCPAAQMPPSFQLPSPLPPRAKKAGLGRDGRHKRADSVPKLLPISSYLSLGCLL